MSFGLAIGDFLATWEQLKSIREKYKTAATRFSQLSETFDNFHHVIEDVRLFQEERLLNPKQGEELSSISNTLRNTLADISAILERFKLLAQAPSEPAASLWEKARGGALKNWKKLQWDMNKDAYRLTRLSTDLMFWREFRDRTMRQRAEREAVLDWIGPSEARSIAETQSCHGAGRWLLESDSFQIWKSGHGGVLLYYGIPGVGKTTMVTTIARHLQKQVDNDPETGIAVIYCDYQLQSYQSYRHLISSILSQLARSRPCIPSKLMQLYERHRTKRTEPSEFELVEQMKTLMTDLSKVFILVDGLDGCSDRVRQQLLARFRIIHADHGINLLATSRHQNALVGFQHCQSIEIRATEEDIRGYLDANMQFLRFNPQPSDLKEKIKDGIIQAVDGMFLLAKIHFENISKARSSKAAEKMLRQLPAGVDALRRAYDSIIKRIRDQGLEELAMPALRIVAFVKRPLSRRELLHALAVEPGSRELDEYNFSDISQVISACAGFLSLNIDNDMVHLVHGTMRKYLQHLDWFDDAEKDIAEICLTYLSFDTFANGHCKTDEELEERFETHAFYEYASRYWAKHVQQSSTRMASLDDTVIEFLCSEQKVSASTQALQVKRTHAWQEYSQRVARNVSGLHLASHFGLSSIVRKLINLGAYAEWTDTRRRTPLSLAAECGDEPTVRLLIETGNGTDLPDFLGRTGLLWAAICGHAKIVELLLTVMKAGGEALDTSGRTLLSWAAGNGHSSVVQILLDNAIVGTDLADNYGRTPLSWAAENGHAHTTKLLLSAGEVEVDRKDNCSRTAFSRAAERGHHEITRLLLETRQIDADSKDADGRTPLSWAAENGCETVVELLVGLANADVLSTDIDGRTPFSWAVSSGQLRVAKLLLQASPVETERVVDCPDIFGWTPLFWAIRDGHVQAVEWLISTGKVDICRADAGGRTPFLWAARNGQEAAVKILLNRPDQIVDLKDLSGRTALSWAAAEGHANVVQLLLRSEININSTDNRYRTSLSWAAGNGHCAVVKLLLSCAQIAADFKDVDERTALSWAAENGHEEVAKLLMASGVVDIYSRDKKGRTPLMLAAANGYEKTVEAILTSSGEGIGIKDLRGRTAFSWAENYGCTEVMELLQLNV